MPRLPADEMRRLVRECLEAEAEFAEVPPDIEGTFVAKVQLTAGSPVSTFKLAVRTITRDVRRAGEWVDRLKIQATSLEGVTDLDALLGINVFGGEPVVVSVDVKRHAPFRGESNNIQFPEALVLEARDVGRVLRHEKGNGEIVTAAPGMLLAPMLCGTLPSGNLGSTTAEDAPVSFRTYRARTRNPQFALGVTNLHDGLCAACGVGLGMTEAAHIVPHALTGDNALENGICLCPNHHTAFDLAHLITFDAERRVWVNAAKMEVLKKRRDQTAGILVVLSYLGGSLCPIPVDQASRLHRRFTQDVEDESRWELFSKYRI